MYHAIILQITLTQTRARRSLIAPNSCMCEIFHCRLSSWKRDILLKVKYGFHISLHFYWWFKPFLLMSSYFHDYVLVDNRTISLLSTVNYFTAMTLLINKLLRASFEANVILMTPDCYLAQYPLLSVLNCYSTAYIGFNLNNSMGFLFWISAEDRLRSIFEMGW